MIHVPLQRRAARTARAVLALALVAACGDDEAAGPAPPASVRIEPQAVELDLGADTVLTATVLDGSGSVLSGRAVVWTSADPSVVEVDGTGRLTGLAAGQTTVRAEAEGVAGETSVVVVPWNISRDAVVVDSAVLRLVGDSAERAAGTYRFERLSDDAPEIAAGATIVGVQGGGFLRRVTAVQTSGSMVTLQTAPAALVDVVRHGSFTTTVELASAPPSLVPGAVPAEGEVLWGPPRLVYAPDGVALTAVGLDLSGVDFCSIVPCPAGLKLELVSGTVGFDPSLEVGATIEEYELTAFDAIATGALTFDFAVRLDAEQAAAFKPEVTLAEIERIFYAQVGWLPVVGTVKFEVKAGLEAKATVKGRVQAGFQSLFQTSVGARYRDDTGWEGVLDGTRTFEAQEPSLSDSTLLGQIELEAKVSITPELKILLYGVAGPFINVEPYGKMTLSFGTEACGLRSVAGVDTRIGFTVEMLDPEVGTFDHTFSPFTWGGRQWDCPLGHLDVATITNGQSQDTDGYRILVDGTEKGTVDPTGSRLVEWVPVGTRSVRLSGVAQNCTVQGENPREVDVEIGLVTPVDFTVDCEEVVDINGGWTLVVDGVCSGSMNVVQDGANFSATGTIGGGFCPFSGSGSGAGTLSGRDITFGIVFSTGGPNLSFNFGGTIAPNELSMSGTYGGPQSGSWQAFR